jgi:hypothetical protein
MCARRVSQLTTGRPKPKKASSRKHASGLLPETGGGVGVLTPSATICKPSTRSAAAQGATRIPAPSRIHQPSTQILVTSSHANPPTPLSTHPPISKPGRPTLNNITDIGVPLSDAAALNTKKKPSLFGLAGPDALPPQRPSQAQPSSASPRSPRRQSRIPSTGTRALVMDVAQALQEAQAPTTGADTTSKSPVSPVAPQQGELQAPPMEKRKSSFDKYSAIVMPPLAEDRNLTTRSLSPEAVVQATIPDMESPNLISPGQQDDSVIKIRE